MKVKILHSPLNMTNKLELQKDIKKELGLYLFITRPIPVSIANESVLVVMAYDIEGAVKRAGQVVPAKHHITHKGRAIKMSELLDKVATQDKKTLVVDKERVKPHRELGVKGFKSGLLYVANELSEKLSKRDKDDLRRIVEKV